MNLKSWLTGLKNHGTGRTATRNNRAGAESLEVRQVPAAVALFIGPSGELNVSVDADDSVRIGAAANGNVTVEVASAGGSFVALPTLGRIPAASVRSIVVLGSDEPNTIDLNGVTAAAFPNVTAISVDAANGNDTLIGSPDLTDSLIGGDGADLINGQGGHDSLNGGNGNDTIIAGDGNDIVRGGDGRDSITGDAGDDDINLGNNDDTVSGGDGNDTVFGDNGQDVINGDVGNDFLNGDGGLDTVDGGDGDDSILGGEFADSLLGGNGNDTINGQAGNDTLSGDAGDDRLEGGVGNDSLVGGDGRDTLNAGAGNDALLGNGGDDSMIGGAGEDSINGQQGNDRVNGQGGNDTLLGGGGADTLDGGDGDDQLDSADATIPLGTLISIGDVVVTEGDDLLTTSYTRDIDLIGTDDPEALVLDDFNGDGLLDIATDEDIYLNIGGGNFGPAAAMNPGGVGGTNYFASGDLDGDRDIDIVVSDDSGDNIFVLANNGNGTFAQRQAFSVTGTFDLDALDLGDLDGDGDLDVFAVQDGIPDVYAVLNNGAGVFGAPRTFTVGTAGFVDVELVDVNGDGDLDAAMVEENTGRLVIMSNNGSANFTAGANLTVGPQATTVTSGDMDGDGDPDLVVVGGRDVSVLINNGSGTFAVTTTNSPLRVPMQDGDLADVDLDGDLDVISSGNGDVNVYGNNGNGTLAAPIAFTTNGGFSRDVSVGDYTGDGLPDLAIAEFARSTVSLLPHQGQSSPVAQVPVQLSQANTTAVTMNFATAAGTAAAGQDFSPVSGTITIPAGATSAIISIPVIGDSLAEPNESFFVNLSNATGGRITDSQGQVLINDDDNGSVSPTLSISNVTINEGNAGQVQAVFTVTLGSPNGSPVSVSFATGDITAQAGDDYLALTGTLSFGPGVTQQTITVTISGDQTPEMNELFGVNLLNPVNAVLLTTQGVGTLVNDDGGVSAAGENDSLLGGNGNDTLQGGGGNDQLNGQAGNDVIRGGDNNDSLVGGGGKDTLDGQAGNDTLDGQAGNDSLIGGDGDDTFVFGGVGSGNDSADGSEGFNTIQALGTSLADTLVVGSTNGLLTVNAGVDSMMAAANIQNVLVDGRGGNDTITVASLTGVARLRVEVRGGDGNDLLDATNAAIGAVRLAMFGDDGNDTINGSLGNDTINGGAGDDSCCGYAGDDTIIGEAGNDLIGGGLGNDSINGGDGDDLLNGQKGDDSVLGGIGNDTLRGEDGNDTLAGELGDDQLNGAAGNDSLLGSSGRDALIGGAGNDTLDGGRNDDVINGNAGDDKIRGDHGHDYIDAGDGHNTINGGDGDDTIIALDGNDSVHGGDGNDRITLAGGNDIAVGGDGDDSILGGVGQDVILGGNGNDSLDGQGGTDVIAGQQGIDVIGDLVAEINEGFVLDAATLAVLRAI